MKTLRFALVAVVLVVLSIAGTLILSRGYGQEPTPPALSEMRGRWQVVPHESAGSTYLIDTAIGRVWQNKAGKWQEMTVENR